MGGEFTEGLRAAIDDARQAYAAFEVDHDADALGTTLNQFRRGASMVRDLLGLADDHPSDPTLIETEPDLEESERFESLLIEVEQAGRDLEAIGEDAPIKMFQQAADHYLSVLNALGQFHEEIERNAAEITGELKPEDRFDLALDSFSQTLQDTGRELTAYTGHQRMSDGLPSAVDLARIRAQLHELNAHAVYFAGQLDDAERQVVGDMASKIADEIPWAERVAPASSATAELFDPFEDLNAPSWDR